MKTRPYRDQSGFALLIFLVVLMGIGGIALTGFAQKSIKEVKKSRFEHNKEVLLQAKQALLMYAYSYPQFNSQGPGRLPCPDDDDDGLTGPLDLALCTTVGRFPWSEPELNFYDARDAVGERLWYAVSNSFYNLGGGPNINSDSTGSITLVDQTGKVIFDGNVSGIAAVIIAPGSAIDGQDRNDDPLDAANYLDSFNGFDNSLFNNGESDTNEDGFILGPVLSQKSVVINDQLIVITAEEVVAMAEKATLAAYRSALNLYSANTDPTNTGLDRYPWLDPYESNDGLATFEPQITDVPSNPVIGRVPSIFTDYFTTNISPTFLSEVNFLLNVDGHPVSARAPTGNTSFLANSNLVSPFNSGASFTGYVWDGHATNPSSGPKDNIWEACPYVTGTEEDCNQDLAGNFIGGSNSIAWLEVRAVTFTFNGTSPFEFLEIDRTGTPLAYTPPDALNHAYVAAVYAGGFIPSVTWSEDVDFQVLFVETSNGNFTFDVGDTISTGVRYYPELPSWAFTNNWHDKIQMAYSFAVQPGGVAPCTVVDCLTLLNSGGVENNKSALLIMSGTDIDGDADNGLVDGGGGPLNFFADDLGDIFEGENNTSPLTGLLADQLTFNRRSNNGNDIVLIVQ